VSSSSIDRLGRLVVLRREGDGASDRMESWLFLLRFGVMYELLSRDGSSISLLAICGGLNGS